MVIVLTVSLICSALHVIIVQEAEKGVEVSLVLRIVSRL